MDAVLRGGEHSLYVQSYRPREMLSGTVNADGYGIGFYPEDDDATPVRYTSPWPIWADANMVALGPRLRTRCALACVRGATPGMPFGASNTPPYQHGRYLFAHNGYIDDFRTTMMRPLRSELRDAYYAGVEGGTDSEHLFALWLELLARTDDRTPAAMAKALTAMLAYVQRQSDSYAREALVNVLITDGTVMLAARYGTHDRAPSLYVRHGVRDETSLVASEPLMAGDAWRAMGANTVQLLRPGREPEEWRV